MSELSCLLDPKLFKKNNTDLNPLLSTLRKYGIKVFLHPFSSNWNSSSMLQKFPLLEHLPSIRSGECLEELFGGISSEEEKFSCQLLYLLFRNCSKFLISNDRDIHRRAQYKGFDERIFSSGDFLEHINQFYNPKLSTNTEIHVDHLPIYNLDDRDEIFESLRNEYEDFDKWLSKCSQEHRKCWVVKGIDNKIAGICIYKNGSNDHEVSELGGKILKACTFKVSEEYRGGKIGELLLKNIFSYCVANDFDHVYLTVFLFKHPDLVEYLKDFGFQIHPREKGDEIICFKTFSRRFINNEPKIPALDYFKKYSPNFLMDESISKYIVPIQPSYHKKLFPRYDFYIEASKSECGILECSSGNAIKKVYLSHSPIKDLEPGSLLLFYRSEDISSLTTFGILEKAQRRSVYDETVSSILKRSAYNEEDVKEILKKETLVIDFRIAGYLKDCLRLSNLKKLGVLKGPPQSITTITNESFQKIKKKILNFYF